MNFQLISNFIPTGDQPEAIQQLVDGINKGNKYQTLLGVTGSGKTFTIANVINQVQKPTLVLSHNKTLAAQLYGEFKQFFPKNIVEYFISYYDYYQPEAYLPATDTYIEKDFSINDEIEKLRLSTSSSLMSGRRDIIVVASVSCIYGIGNPEHFKENTIYIKVNENFGRNNFLRKLVSALYFRNEAEFERGSFRVTGETIDIFPAYADFAYRIRFCGDVIEEIETFNPVSYNALEKFNEINIYPANLFITSPSQFQQAITEIQKDLAEGVEYFKKLGKDTEAKRLYERVSYDIEMLNEIGYCKGIENYSRYFDGRLPGSRPFCLIDFFPDDFLTVIDESHVTVPQLRSMYAGDRSRKQVLVDYGFRLPAALDNRPLKFEEFETIVNQLIFVSATPADYEFVKSEGIIVEQLIRPTGLIDPPVVVRPTLNQIDDLLNEIHEVVMRKERALVTTLTKRMAEELAKYLAKLGIRCRYIHSDIDALERVEIMRDLRLGKFDVLVGINLLREGLDLPEVSLVAILDADKEGFLRNERSLTQVAGRTARNINGKVIMYADQITDSMQKAIDETNRRREKQIAYNIKHNITPAQITKSLKSIMLQTSVIDDAKMSGGKKYYIEKEIGSPAVGGIAADPIVRYMTKEQLLKTIQKVRKDMEKAAKELNFIEAARLRDEIKTLQELYNRVL